MIYIPENSQVGGATSIYYINTAAAWLKSHKASPYSLAE